MLQRLATGTVGRAWRSSLRAPGRLAPPSSTPPSPLHVPRRFVGGSDGPKLAASETPTSNPIVLVARAYLQLLDRYPMTVKSVTSGAMYGLGDVLAQVVDPARPSGAPLDWERAGVFTIYGTLVAGPLYHFWYGNLNQLPFLMMKTRRFRQQVQYRQLQRSAKELGVALPKDTVLKKPKEFSKRTYIVSKVIADQAIFSPLYLLVFFFGTGLMRGKTLQECTEHTKEVFVTSYLADCALWPAAQVINFAFVPVNLQPIYVNVLNVFWNAFLSFMANKSH